MPGLTRPQSLYLREMAVLLVLQLLLVLIVVFAGHRLSPRRVCLFSCRLWLDLFLYLLLAFSLLVVVRASGSYAVRAAAFLGIGLLLSWVLLIQYNISVMRSGGRLPLVASVVCAVALLTASLALIPLLLRYTGILRAVNAVLVVALVLLVVASLLFVRNKEAFRAYLVAGLVVFVGLLLTDTATLVSACRRTGTRECDGPTGATTLYLDLINIVQNLFLVMSQK